MICNINYVLQPAIRHINNLVFFSQKGRETEGLYLFEIDTTNMHVFIFYFINII